MERLLNPADIAARYQCSLPTARARMRQMLHMEKPLMVTEAAVLAWEREKTVCPGEATAPKKKPQRRTGWEAPPMDANGKYHIPRRRA